jgi:hypothetical protein
MSYFEAKLSLTPSPSLRKSDIRDLDTKIDFKFSKVLCNYNSLVYFSGELMR